MSNEKKKANSLTESKVYIPPSTDKEEKKSLPVKEVIKPEIVLKNPYRIVGTARPSKSTMSLSIRLMDNNEPRYLTISKADLNRIFSDPNNLSVADVREYDNENTQKPLKISLTN